MRVCVIILAGACVACSSEAQETIPERDVQPVVTSDRASKQVTDLKERLGTAENTCKNGSSSHGGDGSLAISEVDIAMAESIDSVSPAQEQRIRASLGAEMGLAPNEVDGWREIYRSRAEQARSDLAKAERVKQGACEYLPQLRKELREAEALLALVQDR